MNSETLRLILRNWPTGVTVVTANGPNSHPLGMTVSSFTSVSLEPPLVLVCLYKTTLTTRAVLDTQAFGISILHEDQADVSTRFAGFDPRVPAGADRFDGINYEALITGSPLLSQAIVGLDCKLYAVHEGGTHLIIVGEVVATTTPDTSRSPLAYYNRGYYHLRSMDSG